MDGCSLYGGRCSGGRGNVVTQRSFQLSSPPLTGCDWMQHFRHCGDSRDCEDGEDDNEMGLNQPFTPVRLRLSVMFLLLVHLLRPGRRINPRSDKAR
jgi:hypothetical protein